MARTIRMPSAEDIDKAYTDSTGRVPARYGAAAARVTDFKESSGGGQKLYEQKMSDAAVLARRKTAIDNMPDNAWNKGVAEKGIKRIAEGMRLGAAKRRTNYEPIRGKLDGMALADKTADWETNVDNNVKAVIRAQKEAAGKS